MTPAQRTTLSFLDLALIMTGVMAMIASVPKTIARGRLRCGSVTSPLAKVRSANPS